MSHRRVATEDSVNPSTTRVAEVVDVLLQNDHQLTRGITV